MAEHLGVQGDAQGSGLWMGGVILQERRQKTFGVEVKPSCYWRWHGLFRAREREGEGEERERGEGTENWAGTRRIALVVGLRCKAVATPDLH